MILFPNAKINIGLDVIRKRPDNFHDIETIFYPLSLCDILEINKSDKFHFSVSGLSIPEGNGPNIVIKAYQLLNDEFHLPAINVHLHKQIPAGAGLGGGSSDAAFTLLGLNDLFNLKIDNQTLIKYALQLGSDCAFFIKNIPVFAEGRGDIFSEINITLKDFSLVLVKPGCFVSTAEAYSRVKPSIPGKSLKYSIGSLVDDWKDIVFNRFEPGIFSKFREIEQIKESLYREGAVYASMSGSGSSVFGLFRGEVRDLHELFPGCFYWQEECGY